MATIENFANYLTAFAYQGPFLALKIIFFILSFLFLIITAYFLKTSGYHKIRIWQDVMEIFTYRPYGIERISKKWQEIKSRLDSPSEAEHKLAVIEAEDILDNILKRMGYKGETLEERLNQLSPFQLPTIGEILEVHKIRNNIIYDPDYRLSLEQAKKILEIYEKTFKDLQAL